MHLETANADETHADSFHNYALITSYISSTVAATVDVSSLRLHIELRGQKGQTEIPRPLKFCTKEESMALKFVLSRRPLLCFPWDLAEYFHFVPLPY